MGDVKLSMFVGAVLGPAAVPPFLVIACALGGLGGLLALARGAGRHATIAYAPYLALAATVVAFRLGPIAAR
jgi:prepilin signal peptidase PulO-like enzyme (type II secretory pathway)